MKTAFIITSAIDVNNAYPLTYSSTRSYFSAATRLKQTLVTIECINRIANEDTVIYLLDSSANNDYRLPLSLQPNLKFISVRDTFPHLHQEVTTHPHKSRCECLVLSEFFSVFSEELDQFDQIFKISGRYFFDSTFILPNTKHESIFFKNPQCFTWQDHWGLHYLDLRSEQGDNTLRQYPTTLMGWSTKYNQTFKNLFYQIANTVNEPGKSGSDMETLLYFFTRRYKEYIIETNWTIFGWNGVSGKFVTY